MQINSHNKRAIHKLYKKDETAWILENIKLIREKKFNDIDYENIATILEEEVISYKLDVNRRVRHSIQYLLQFQYQKRFRKEKRWDIELYRLRCDLEYDFKYSETLKGYIQSNLETIYQEARELSSSIMKISIYSISDKCLFTLEQILDPDFIPMRENV